MCKIIDDWFVDCFVEGVMMKNVNMMVLFLMLVYCYEEMCNLVYLLWLEMWVEWVMNEMFCIDYGGMQYIMLVEENYQQMWDDMLMMMVLLLVKIGKLLNWLEYVEEVIYQFLLYVQNLMDKEMGLWFYGWSYDGYYNFVNVCWVCGNSWLIIVILDFFELLDLLENNVVCCYLVQVLNVQIVVLVKCQDESGLWYMLFDDLYFYFEVLVMVGFVYGIFKVVCKCYVEWYYVQVVEKVIWGIVKYILLEGELL